MDLLNLKSNKGARKNKKRIGRGNASGHGTYSTRGMNGQTARSGGRVRPGFEGGQTTFVQRMPKLKGFTNPTYIKYQVVNVKDLNNFDDGAIVDKESMLKAGLIDKKRMKVKVLGDGELTKKLTVKVDAITKSAKEKIEKANGSVEIPTLKPLTKRGVKTSTKKPAVKKAA
ncbi:50S ribosomal protein L15 [Patescibacteria group bacterium]|nr:50S ribosomal protein L15 [Patescibacteria group bacterium]